MSSPPFRRAVLVGFMGSGKSTVGRILARELGWSFVDLDRRVEEEFGRPVAEIFRLDGEASFRATEARLAESALGRDDTVVATGGGWGAHPGRLSAMPDGTVTVWLEVSVDEALRRVEGQGGQRPLLDGPDPAGRASALLERRAPYYGKATLRVDTEGLTPEDVSRRILELLGRLGPALDRGEPNPA